MPSPDELPTFFIVGAPKAGTTSLHAYLAEHPEIAMSTIKEPMCFATDNWADRLGEYRDLFPVEAAVRGEASTAYGAHPWQPEIPDRIKSTVPDAKIIYMVRDPVPRTLAHYAQNVWDDFPVRPFDELMDDLEHPMNMPVWCSRYATQLQRWLDRYPAEYVLVLDQRDLLEHRAETLRRVLAFLGVDAGFRSEAWDATHNTAVTHRRPNRVARALGRRGIAAAEHGRLPWLLSSPVPKPTLSPEQRRGLEGVLRPEAERLQKLSGVNVERWTLS
jgi:hypothetical protein